MPSPLLAYALAALLSLAPAAHRSAPAGWEESPQFYEMRMESIAVDIEAVARSRTDVAALVGVAVEESALSPDIDAGQCWVRSGCDGGTHERPRAIGIWQLHASSAEEDAVLRTDRRFGAALALRRIWAAQRRCRALAPELRLVGLLGGPCVAEGEAARVARRLDGFVRRALAVRE